MVVALDPFSTTLRSPALLVLFLILLILASSPFAVSTDPLESPAVGFEAFRYSASDGDAEGVAAGGQGGGCEKAIREVIQTILSLQKQQRLRFEEGGNNSSNDDDEGVRSLLRRRRPFVTLTYAQSLDGFIAVRKNEDRSCCGVDGVPSTSSNLRLSCSESTVLTHGLRSIHDAVLVGSNTLATDNPRLNVRLWPPPRSTSAEGGSAAEESNASPSNPRQPRPVVLDTDLRAVRSILARRVGGGDGALRATGGLIACCSRAAAERAQDDEVLRSALELELATPSGVGGTHLPALTLLPCDLRPPGSNGCSGGLDLSDVMRRLRSEYGILSVMVEGGAGVLSSFASSFELEEDNGGGCGGGGGRGEGGDGNRGREGGEDRGGGSLIDCAVITISPSIIGGQRGMGAFGTLDGAEAAAAAARRGCSAVDGGKGDKGQDGVKSTLIIRLQGPLSKFVTGIGRDCVFIAEWPL